MREPPSGKGYGYGFGLAEPRRYSPTGPIARRLERAATDRCACGHRLMDHVSDGICAYEPECPCRRPR